MKLVGLNIETDEAKLAILDAVDQGMAIAELEPLGVSMRTICGLESKLGIIYLEELLSKTFSEITGTRSRGVGAKAFREIETALNALPTLTKKFKKSFEFKEVPLLCRAKQMRDTKATKEQPKYDCQGSIIE